MTQIQVRNQYLEMHSYRREDDQWTVKKVTWTNYDKMRDFRWTVATEDEVDNYANIAIACMIAETFVDKFGYGKILGIYFAQCCPDFRLCRCFYDIGRENYKYVELSAVLKDFTEEDLISGNCKILTGEMTESEKVFSNWEKEKNSIVIMNPSE